MITKSKTMDEFWGHFLQVTFHDGKPERWTVRMKKAEWCISHLNLKPGSSVLGLACGDGIVDIWLSRFQCKVTAVDRLGSVLEHARGEDDTKAVQFIQSELQKINFPEKSYEGIFIFETLGLLKKEEDYKLLQEAYQWLKPGGRVAVDCPVAPSEKNFWEIDFPHGKVQAATSFDLATRIHKLKFNFYPTSGEPFKLEDANCSNYSSEPGISRFIYTDQELREILEKIGFKVETAPHYYEESYFALIGVKN